jgi:hypothetical protein
MDDHYRARALDRVPYLRCTWGQLGIRPVKQPLGLRHAQIHAAMAPCPAKIVVPVGPVDGIGAVEVHHVWHVGLLIIRPAHGLREKLAEDAEATDYRGRLRGTRGHCGAKYFHFPFVGNQCLRG